MAFRRQLMAGVAALALVAAACSDDDDDGSAGAGDETEADAGSDSSETGETVTIAASVPPTDHGWLGQIAAKAQEAADQWDDVEFRLVEAADADSQASQIQTLINPPGNAKARFLTNAGKHASAEEFLAGAETHSGSWWPHWLSWLNAHGRSKVVAPQTLGSQRHQPVMDAPGSYALAAV